MSFHLNIYFCLVNELDPLIEVTITLCAIFTGSCRNVYFPFDIYTDTPIDVAIEMVKELEITDLKPSDIASMIEGEISVLLPNWRNSNNPDTFHTFRYNDDMDNGDPHHHFHSISSCSSSQESTRGSVSRVDDLLNGYHWLHGMSPLSLPPTTIATCEVFKCK